MDSIKGRPARLAEVSEIGEVLTQVADDTVTEFRDCKSLHKSRVSVVEILCTSVLRARNERSLVLVSGGA